MKVLLSLMLASAVTFTAAPASAFCLKKPSKSELQSVTLEEVRKMRAGQSVFLDDITIPDKKCTALKNTWTAITPIGQFFCKATDQMERPSCTRSGETPQQQASIEPTKR